MKIVPLLAIPLVAACGTAAMDSSRVAGDWEAAACEDQETPLVLDDNGNPHATDPADEPLELRYGVGLKAIVTGVVACPSGRRFVLAATPDSDLKGTFIGYAPTEEGQPPSRLEHAHVGDVVRGTMLDYPIVTAHGTLLESHVAHAVYAPSQDRAD
jgi:hypothetical protein